MHFKLRPTATDQRPSVTLKPLKVKRGGNKLLWYRQAFITQDLDTFRSLAMSICPPYAPFFGFAGVASSVSFYSPRHATPPPIPSPPRVLIVGSSCSSMPFRSR